MSNKEKKVKRENTGLSLLVRCDPGRKRNGEGETVGVEEKGNLGGGNFFS